jgi:D-inositol-3-phosphate glycosyltransferase
MKIILISPAHPLRGGIAASSERLAQALQSEGHEVVVYSFALQYPSFLFPGKTQLTTDPAPSGLRIVTCLNSINPFNWWRVGRAIAREGADHVVVRFWLPFMGPCLGSTLRVTRWFSKKKIHVTALVDNIIPHEKRVGDRPFARYFVGACNDFVVMSESVGTEIRRFLPADTAPNAVRFAPHPVYDIYGAAQDRDAARKALGLPDSAHHVLLFFGLIRPYKGLDVLLDALADPRLRVLNVQLLVAGECYDDWSDYESQIGALDLTDRVHAHVRYIGNDEVARYFSAADLVVQPYKTATQSGVLQVAYHFERPVVVTAVGGLPEMVAEGQSGYVVPANHPTAIADSVVDFFKNKKSSTLQTGVRAIKSRFSWENLVRVVLGK